MHQPVKQLSIAALLGLLAFNAAAGVERQSILEVRRAVVDFVTAQHSPDADLEVVPDRLDPRLRLARCEEELDTFWAPGSAQLGQTTVGIRCAGTRPWKLYLPTRVRLMQPVVVAARPLARGQRLGAGDIRMDKRDVGALRGSAILDPDQVLTYMMRRPVVAGRVLVPDLLEAPVLVERNRRVMMSVGGQGIAITMSGTALEDGALGETIRVRNPASRRVVEGVVTGLGKVRLLLPRPPQKISSNQ